MRHILSPVLALAAYLYKLLQDDDLYMEYFQWRKYFNVFRYAICIECDGYKNKYCSVSVSQVYQILVPSVKKSNRKIGRLPRLIE